VFYSYLDTTGACVCDSQVIHFHPGAIDSSGDAKGCQDITWLGLGYWEEKTKDALKDYIIAWSDVP